MNFKSIAAAKWRGCRSGPRRRRGDQVSDDLAAAHDPLSRRW